MKSPLDEIFAKHERLTGAKGIVTEARATAKQEIKSLFMELLGEDENPEEEYSHLHPDTRLNMPLREYRQYTDERNELKAELRKKIEDL